MGKNITKDTLVSLSIGECPYIAEIVKIEGKDPFLSISGSKKGTRYCGGGIAISNLHMLDDFLNLMDVISHLEIKDSAQESRVSFFTDRTRFFAGETKCFDDRWFYRIKVYNNNFVNKETGERFFFKGHELRPAGYGRFIQEFDFPISPTGIEECKKFSVKILETIKQYLKRLVDQAEDNLLDLILNGQILIGGEPPWFNSKMDLEKVTLHKPLFDILCDKLREGPLTPNRLAIHLGLTPYFGDNQLNPASRYDPRFFQQGFLLDRISKGFDSLHYLITQIPQEAFEESPALTYLFDEDPPGKWSDWISATFSNDEYSTGRRQSYHFAEFEIETFEGSLEWGIVPELPQLRASTIRLFDLKRHFQRDEVMTKNIDVLIKRFILLTKEIDHG